LVPKKKFTENSVAHISLLFMDLFLQLSEFMLVNAVGSFYLSKPKLINVMYSLRLQERKEKKLLNKNS